MNTESTITILSSLFELGGVGIFLWYVFKGLKTEISNLNATVEAQKKTLEAQRETLDAMEMRVQETEKFRDLYRKFLNDLPDDIDKYKSVLAKLKDEVIKELEDANTRKDEKLKQFSESKLAELEAQENLLEELPKLRENLIQTQHSIEARLTVLDVFHPSKPLGKLLKDLERVAEERGYSSKSMLFLVGDKKEE